MKTESEGMAVGGAVRGCKQTVAMHGSTGPVVVAQ